MFAASAIVTAPLVLLPSAQSETKYERRPVRMGAQPSTYTIAPPTVARDWAVNATARPSSHLSTLRDNAEGNAQKPWQSSTKTKTSFSPAAQQTSVAAINSPAHSPLSMIADALHVRFQGYKDINGTYRLNEDETISIPGVGRISIAGMTASDLEQALAKHIMGSTGRMVPVSVEVETYRHVFVDGVVDKPGSFQWQRGLTVIKAISMTGGIYRPQSKSGRLTSPVAQRGQLDIARLKLAQALVRQSRVAAELQNTKSIKVPERLIGILGRERANELVETEQSILDNRRTSQKARLDALTAQKDAIESQVERLETLIKGMAARTRNHAGLLTKLRQTYRAGAISNRRLFEVEARLGDLEEKLASTNVQLVRAKSSQQLLESKRSELIDTYREQLIEQDIKSQAEIRTFQIEFDTAFELLRTSGSGPAITTASNPAQKQPNFEIIRRTAKGEQRIGAKPLDTLLPGDTLVVSHVTGTDDDK